MDTKEHLKVHDKQIASIRVLVKEDMQLHEVITATQDPDGPGWVVDLDCGHTIWCSGPPLKLMICGQCLTELAALGRSTNGRHQ